MIAILGATGYVGRSLARVLAVGRPGPVNLFARNPAALGEHWPAHVQCRGLADFNAGEFELVINAIGAGDPMRVKELASAILDVTYVWDQRVLEMMTSETRYVFLS